MRDYESTLIVLECSGMADPAEVVDAVTDAYVSRIAKLERVLALLHPVPLPDTGMAELVIRNAIRYADDLILNKTRPLHSRPLGTVPRDHHRLQSLRQALGNQPCEAGPGFVAGRAASRPAPTNVLFEQSAPHGTHHDARASHHPMVTTVRLPGPLDRTRFTQWMQTLPEGVERAKGFFRFAGEPELQEFQFFPPRTGTLEPVMLLDEPDHVVVLIGRDFDQAGCRAALLACLA